MQITWWLRRLTCTKPVMMSENIKTSTVVLCFDFYSPANGTSLKLINSANLCKVIL